MLVGFIAENSLFLSLSGKLIELSKDLSKDELALKTSLCILLTLDLLKEIALHLGVRFRNSYSFVACHWQSVYDTSIEVQHTLEHIQTLFLSNAKSSYQKKAKRI